MIKINIPNNNFNERKYILDIIFSEFLELNYSIEVGSGNYELELENGTILIIEDHFFNNFPEDLGYLKEQNIPKKVELLENEFIVEDNIPVIYGNSKFKIQNSKVITCGIDIFASSFFMLARWEEYVNKNRDIHNRFPAYESLAFKNDFLDRPIVNEYVEMLKNMLLSLDSSLTFKTYKYKLFLTHDIDKPQKYKNFKIGLREIARDIIKRKDIKKAFTHLIEKLKVHFHIEKDPFDTFDYLMEVSEKIGVQSYFFFMGSGLTKYDNMYAINDDFIRHLIMKIKSRGHCIGIHPTYDAYNNCEQFKKEKLELEKNLEITVLSGREHYLRFELPATWQIWEECGMEWDSTLSFADKEGFRCGVCYAYSVFNVLSRQKLKLKERPLIVMEGSFTTYQSNIKPQDMEKKIIYLIEKVKKYNGDFVFLWHNSSFNTQEWEKYQYIYEKVLK